jgi:putative effector of murein hydrolase LrgA (UPF0299 family)
VTTAKHQYLTTTEPVQNALLTFVSTVVVFFVSGRVTQFFLRKGKEDDKK